MRMFVCKQAAALTFEKRATAGLVTMVTWTLATQQQVPSLNDTTEQFCSITQ